MIDWEQTSSVKNPTQDEEYKRVEKMINDAMDEAEKMVNQPQKKMLKKEWARNDWRQAFINYAYQIGWEDLVYTLECENATRNMYRQSDVVSNWKREQSYWFCQIHKPSNPDIVNDPLFRSDWKWQIDRCLEIRNREKSDWIQRFYWRTRKYNGMNCVDFVKSRFYFE